MMNTASASSRAQLNSLLSALNQRASRCAPDPRRVYPLQVCFHNPRDRKRYFTRLAKNGIDIDGKEQEYGFITNAAYTCRESGTLMMFASRPNPVFQQTPESKSGKATDADRKKHRDGESDWFVFGVCYKHHKLYIFYPDYTPPSSSENENEEEKTPRRIVSFAFLNIARTFIGELERKGKNVNEIWIGGGGDDGQSEVEDDESEDGDVDEKRSPSSQDLTALWMRRIVTLWMMGKDEAMMWNGWERIVK